MKFGVVKVGLSAAALLVAMLFASQARAQAVVDPTMGDWTTTLLGRDINGYAVSDLNDPSVAFLYDTTLNVTWVRDGRLIAQSYWSPVADAVSALAYGGYSDWRLPAQLPVNGSAYNDAFSNNGTTDLGYAKTGVGWGTANELGHLFYVTLGNKGYCTPNDASPSTCAQQPGADRVNVGSFQISAASAYFTDHYYNPGVPIPSLWEGAALTFGEPAGRLEFLATFYGAGALPARTGDVLAVPESQTLLLMLTGLTALAVLRRPGRLG